MRDGYRPRQGGTLVEWTKEVRENVSGVVIFLNMEACQTEGLTFQSDAMGLIFEGFGTENLIPPFLFMAAEDLDEGVWLLGGDQSGSSSSTTHMGPLFHFQHESQEGGRQHRPSITGESSQTTEFPPITVLDKSWEEPYTESSHWCDFWDQTHGSRGSWPPHVRLFGDKMYFEGRLCVPENLVFNVLAAHHEAMGHLGANRLVTEAQRRYALPPSVALTPLAREIRRTCPVCQACEPPNFDPSTHLRMTCVPDRVFAHVCVCVHFLNADRGMVGG